MAANKVTIGQTTVEPQNQVTIGKPQGGVSGVEIGPVQIEQRKPLIDPDGHIDFSDFFALCQGNPQIAESLIPGSAAKGGAMLLKSGPNGPRLRMTNPAAQARAYDLHHAHKLGQQKHLSAKAEGNRLLDDAVNAGAEPEEMTPVQGAAGHPNLQKIKFRSTNDAPANKLVSPLDTNETEVT